MAAILFHLDMRVKIIGCFYRCITCIFVIQGSTVVSFANTFATSLIIPASNFLKWIKDSWLFSSPEFPDDPLKLPALPHPYTNGPWKP